MRCREAAAYARATATTAFGAHDDAQRKLVGSAARTGFFDLLRTNARTPHWRARGAGVREEDKSDSDEFEYDDSEEEESGRNTEAAAAVMHSPRQQMIDACHEHGLLPQPLALIGARRRDVNEIDLTHRGIGDEYAAPLAAALQVSDPTALRLRDCRLGATGSARVLRVLLVSGAAESDAAMEARARDAYRAAKAASALKARRASQGSAEGESVDETRTAEELAKLAAETAVGTAAGAVVVPPLWGLGVPGGSWRRGARGGGQIIGHGGGFVGGRIADRGRLDKAKITVQVKKPAAPAEHAGHAMHAKGGAHNKAAHSKAKHKKHKKHGAEPTPRAHKHKKRAKHGKHTHAAASRTVNVKKAARKLKHHAKHGKKNAKHKHKNESGGKDVEGDEQANNANEGDNEGVKEAGKSSLWAEAEQWAAEEEVGGTDAPKADENAVSADTAKSGKAKHAKHAKRGKHGKHSKLKRGKAGTPRGASRSPRKKGTKLTKRSRKQGKQAKAGAADREADPAQAENEGAVVDEAVATVEAEGGAEAEAEGVAGRKGHGQEESAEEIARRASASWKITQSFRVTREVRRQSQENVLRRWADAEKWAETDHNESEQRWQLASQWADAERRRSNEAAPASIKVDDHGDGTGGAGVDSGGEAEDGGVAEDGGDSTRDKAVDFNEEFHGDPLVPFWERDTFNESVSRMSHHWQKATSGGSVLKGLLGALRTAGQGGDPRFDEDGEGIDGGNDIEDSRSGEGSESGKRGAPGWRLSAPAMAGGAMAPALVDGALEPAASADREFRIQEPVSGKPAEGAPAMQRVWPEGEAAPGHGDILPEGNKVRSSGRRGSNVTNEANNKRPSTMRRRTSEIRSWQQMSSALGVDKLEELRHRLLAASYTCHGEDLQVLFGRWDKDHGGSLSHKELHAIVQRMLPNVVSDEQLLWLIEFLDENHDGAIEFGEFAAFISTPMRMPEKEQAAEEVVDPVKLEEQWVREWLRKQRKQIQSQPPRKLRELDLSENRLGELEHTEDGRLLLARILGTPTRLHTLDLAHNSIGDRVAVALCEGLRGNESLTLLDLSHNCIGGRGASEVGATLMHNHSLRTLSLAHNTLVGDDGSGAARLIRALQWNDTLKSLDLSFCALRGRPHVELVAGLVRKTADISLTHLDLSCTSPTAEEVEQLAIALRHNQFMHLHYHGNGGFVDSLGFLHPGVQKGSFELVEGSRTMAPPLRKPSVVGESLHAAGLQRVAHGSALIAHARAATAHPPPPPSAAPATGTARSVRHDCAGEHEREDHEHAFGNARDAHVLRGPAACPACWLCGQWRPIRFAWNAQFSGPPALVQHDSHDRVEVRVHASHNDYCGVLMAPVMDFSGTTAKLFTAGGKRISPRHSARAYGLDTTQLDDKSDTFSSYRACLMCPPTTLHYYFSFSVVSKTSNHVRSCKVTVAEDQPHADGRGYMLEDKYLASLQTTDGSLPTVLQPPAKRRGSATVGTAMHNREILEANTELARHRSRLELQQANFMAHLDMLAGATVQTSVVGSRWRKLALPFILPHARHKVHHSKKTPFHIPKDQKLHWHVSEAKRRAALYDFGVAKPKVSAVALRRIKGKDGKDEGGGSKRRLPKRSASSSNLFAEVEELTDEEAAELARLEEERKAVQKQRAAMAAALAAHHAHVVAQAAAVAASVAHSCVAHAYEEKYDHVHREMKTVLLMVILGAIDISQRKQKVQRAEKRIENIKQRQSRTKSLWSKLSRVATRPKMNVAKVRPGDGNSEGSHGLRPLGGYKLQRARARAPFAAIKAPGVTPEALASLQAQARLHKHGRHHGGVHGHYSSSTHKKHAGANSKHAGAKKHAGIKKHHKANKVKKKHNHETDAKHNRGKVEEVIKLPAVDMPGNAHVTHSRRPV
eukprot:g619.t1